MSYTKYGVSRELVERVKLRMKDPAVKERVSRIAQKITKADLQNRTKIRQLIGSLSQATGVAVPPDQEEAIIQFVIAQKIDPNNTFHLIKLWGMFR